MNSEHMPSMTITQILSAGGIVRRNGYQESSEPGKKYEQWIYYGFKSQFQKGNFEEVKRNQQLQFPVKGNPDSTHEVDILFRRKGILGFVSIKSGKGFVINNRFREEKRIILDSYPEYLAGKPCLRVLVYRYGISKARFKRMMRDSVLIIDHISDKTSFAEMFSMIYDAADYLAGTGEQLPRDYYNRYMQELCDVGGEMPSVHNTYVMKLLRSRNPDEGRMTDNNNTPYLQ